MREQLRMRQQLEQALRRAVEERTLTLRPSARHALVDGRLVAVEAELVWRHPVRGLVSIEDDLVFAERKGLGRVIADIALDRIFAFLPELRRQSPACRLCVAFSPTQLANPGLVESLLERLEAAGLEGDQLQVELLTGVAWSLEGDALVAPLRRLAAAGINVGLRGFGADHVAFHELRHLPLDSLILASELVADLGRRDEAEVFLEALAGLGRRLGKRVVARGVATPDQMEILSQSGCEEAAGPLFAGETNAPAVRRAG
jgi:EAL domain-containing protein (putative c-di-GMP-specific phosphodiesterase class I)